MNNKDILEGINIPLKDDDGKSRVDLIDSNMLLELGDVLNYGTIKYKENSWQGVELKKHIGAALRHIYKFQTGEDYDLETGHSHLIHAIANLMFANYNKKRF